MPLENQLKKPDISKVQFWLFSTLAFLFFMGALYLAMITCDEFVKNPNICNSISIINSFTPWILLLLFGVTALALIFYSLGYANSTLSSAGRRQIKREKNIARRGF